MEKHKQKKKHKKRKHQMSSDIAVHKEYKYDLRHHLHNRKELLRQAFQCLEPEVLHVMLPHSVKHLPSSHLQQLCLEQAESMSLEQLRAVIEGTGSRAPSLAPSLDTISSSESSLQETAVTTTAATTATTTVTESVAKTDALELLELEARARLIRARLAVADTGNP